MTFFILLIPQDQIIYGTVRCFKGIVAEPICANEVSSTGSINPARPVPKSPFGDLGAGEAEKVLGKRLIISSVPFVNRLAHR